MSCKVFLLHIPLSLSFVLSLTPPFSFFPLYPFIMIHTLSSELRRSDIQVDYHFSLSTVLLPLVQESDKNYRQIDIDKRKINKNKRESYAKHKPRLFFIVK